MAGSTYQVLHAPNNRTYIGSGKVTEVARAVRALNAETVIFDDELSPGQVRAPLMQRPPVPEPPSSPSGYLLLGCSPGALLSPVPPCGGQIRNLDKAFNSGEAGALPVKVCDRTALILDIFSQRAQTREGKLQVGGCGFPVCAARPMSRLFPKPGNRPCM